jgi:hypothetical protein
MNVSRLKRRVRRALLLSAAVTAGTSALLASSPSAHAQQIISVDFGGGGGGGTTGTTTAMTPAETAGVIPAANWNSFIVNTQATAQPLVDATGAGTGATVTWTSNNTWNTGTVAGPGNYHMMKGYLDSTETSVTSVNVANLPASLTGSPYSVIMYYDGDNGANNRVGKYSISGATTGNATYWGRDAGNATYVGAFIIGQTATDPVPGAPQGSGTMDNNAAAANAVPAGNMVIFRGLTGSSFTLSGQASVASDATNRSAIEGFQIMPDTLVPEPGSLGVIGLAAVGLLARRRKRD